MSTNVEDTLLGKFAVTRRLGRGGMGAVYQGYDAALDRRVAIKTLTSNDITDRDSRERFEREARAAAKLQHPNIVTMYELGNFGKTERPYIVMEFLEGTDLTKAIREEPTMPLAEVLDVAVQLCRALDFAHRHGVVHRDMKPANVRYLDNGQVKIMDFGIARLEGSKTLTKSGTMVGTLQYMSPEQIRGRDPIDGRSDLFSVGCIIYEMLCGSRAFEGDNATTILFHIVNEEPTPILDKKPELPQELAAILGRAMAKSVEERFPSGEAMAAELEKLASIHRKASTWSRPDVQKHYEELEEFRRKGKWRQVVEKASSMLERDPQAVAPYRALRQGHRMLASKSLPAEAAGVEAEKERLDISRELSHLYGVDLPTLPDQASLSPPGGIEHVESSPPARAAANPWIWILPGVAVLVVVAVLMWRSMAEPGGATNPALQTSEPVLEPAGNEAAPLDAGARPAGADNGEAAPTDRNADAVVGDRLEHELGIVSTPGASIAVNGADTGVRTRNGRVTIPLTGVAGDSFTVRLTLSGFGPVEQQVVLGKQAPPDWQVRLSARVSSVELTSEPIGASVQLDGRALTGETPMVVDWTVSRTHRVTFSKQGYADRTVNVSAGDRPPSPITLSRLRRNGSIRVVADYPLGVRLGERELIAVGASETAAIASGTHQLILVAPDVFLNRGVSVSVAEDVESSLEAPALGRISIRANPGRCDLRIGAFDAGAAPIMNHRIVTGNHTIVFTWPDGTSIEETTVIQAGRPAFVIGQKP